MTVLTEADTSKVKAVGDDASRTDPDACYVQMAINGEKVINQPVTFGGVTYFSTSRPARADSRARRSSARPTRCP